ncbi:MAG: hypothetical protein ACLTNJ_05275 [Parabacteroides distasonis]
MRTFRYILSLLAATLALLAQPAMAQAPETSTKAQPSDPVFPYLLTIQQPAEGATLDVMIMTPPARTPPYPPARPSTTGPR